MTVAAARLATAVGLAAAVSAPACPLVTAILQRPGAKEASFEGRLLKLSNLLQALFFDTGFDQATATRVSGQALEDWMNLYLAHYLDPPPSFRGNPRWRELMDSVTGPLRRLRHYAVAGDALRGHHQLRVLQDSLTEFYGDPPARKAGGLGPVFHTLETLQYIEGDTAAAARERRSRLVLLRDRFDAWLAELPARRRDDTDITRFAADLRALEATPDPALGAAGPAVQALIAQTEVLLKAATRSAWSRPRAEAHEPGARGPGSRETEAREIEAREPPAPAAP